MTADNAPVPVPAPEIVVQFVVGAYMSVVTWWLDRGAKEPPEEIDRAFRELAMGSLRTWFDHRPPLDDSNSKVPDG